LLSEKHKHNKDRLRYLAAVGMELTAEVEVSGALNAPSEAFDVNKGIAWAFQYRPELKQTQFQEKIDSLRVNLSLTERLPTISLGANYEWVGDQFPLSQKNWNTTINFNLPIFDGWAAWSRIKQHRIQAREAKIRRAEIEDQVRLQVRDAAMDYEFWKDQAESVDVAAGGDAEKRLQRQLRNIDTLKEACRATAVLEWAVGTNLK
jgi:outer membrane protein TolC